MKVELGEQDLVQAFSARESLYCGNCLSNLRVRRIADVLLRLYAETATSLAELVREASFRRLAIAEINAIGSMHPVLSSHPGLEYSEFGGGSEGTPRPRSEDIQQLSYPDASFDLVLTSDTLEHVPDYRRALAETRRILRLGGRHVFTVPIPPAQQKTRRRVTMKDGVPKHHAPPLYHGRGSGPLALLSSRRNDFLVYTDFGLDLVDQLRSFGFEPILFPSNAGPGTEDAGLVISAEAV
jgi:SAM-dependent methyltransferase